MTPQKSKYADLGEKNFTPGQPAHSGEKINATVLRDAEQRHNSMPEILTNSVS
jgi:hypothetical protein